MNATCSDILPLETAEGLLHHDEPDEAAVGLAGMDPRCLHEPWQLQVLYQGHEAEGRWVECLDVANILSWRYPDLHEGPMLQARALHELGFTAEAWKILRPIARKRPGCWLIHIDLAVYACRLGYLRLGRPLLLRAVLHGGATAIQVALERGGLEAVRSVLTLGGVES